MSGNLALWDSVSKTDPSKTKGFTGKGGFSGTAVSPMYLIHRATELWGPMGLKWGITVVSERIEALSNGEAIHIVQAELYFPAGGDTARIPAFGQTMILVGRGAGEKRYLYADEDAPKKSLTDALTKALSWIGFAADIHMGLYDDVKYVQEVKAEFAAEKHDRELRSKMLPILETAAAKGEAALAAAWQAMHVEARRACADDKDALKAVAKEIDAAKAKKELAHAAS